MEVRICHSVERGGMQRQALSLGAHLSEISFIDADLTGADFARNG